MVSESERPTRIRHSTNLTSARCTSLPTRGHLTRVNSCILVKVPICSLSLYLEVSWKQRCDSPSQGEHLRAQVRNRQHASGGTGAGEAKYTVPRRVFGLIRNLCIELGLTRVGRA
jgi:hypothetical protein